MLRWVRHEVSGAVVELDDEQLAHPILGAYYHPVKVKNGKPVILPEKTDEENAAEAEAARIAAEEEAARIAAELADADGKKAEGKN